MIAGYPSMRLAAYSAVRARGMFGLVLPCCALLAAACAREMYDVEEIQPAPIQPDPIVEVSALWLVTRYLDDPRTADQQYMGKLLWIRGTIATTGSDFVILTGGSHHTVGVQCFFQGLGWRQLQAVSPGQVVIVKGQGMGMGRMHVQVQDCQIEVVRIRRPTAMLYMACRDSRGAVRWLFGRIPLTGGSTLLQGS